MLFRSSTLSLKRGSILDESCPLEDSPQERYDAYGFGKLKQEEVVREYGSRYGLPYVILRPGYVFGPGKQELSGRIGVNTFGFFIQVNGSNLLPLSFVDNCAETIVLGGLRPGVEGEIFNVVDDELLSGRQFFKEYSKKVNSFSIRIPYAFATCYPRYGRSIPDGQRISYLQHLIAAAAQLNGKATATLMIKFASGLIGSRACLWIGPWRLSSVNSTPPAADQVSRALQRNETLLPCYANNCDHWLR